ncbi:hypothetical protein GALMADRAFT_799737 [Galerina marginata CBS 339.88]|uniref:Uncharacterized protein n=1 Tax=Galerina marginata (strain CBS 339.88) TaxID=685588 RepID=A0A067SMW0_GALM3|nr:hypothetical protein GALMADRAFT_799737 [Galerina marginata CBS 339.88]
MFGLMALDMNLDFMLTKEEEDEEKSGPGLHFPEPSARVVPGFWKGDFHVAKIHFLPSIRQDAPSRHHRPWWFGHQSQRIRLLFPQLSRFWTHFRLQVRLPVLCYYSQSPFLRTIYLATVGLGGSGIEVDVRRLSLVEFAFWRSFLPWLFAPHHRFQHHLKFVWASACGCTCSFIFLHVCFSLLLVTPPSRFLPMT